MSKAIQQTSEYYFLTDDSADATWLKDSVSKQLDRLALESAKVVIALGFMDCVYSCLWPEVFDIDTSIEQYTSIINEFTGKHPNFNFYFCSVNPINSDYNFAGNKIEKSQLINKINYFNKKIKESYNITFIDSYDYLSKVNFVTRDGIYYTSSTCNALHSYIKKSANIDFILNKDDICTANSYSISTEDMKPNARYIYQYLRNRGWTINAIAGLLGNIQVESKMSPWIWQGTIEGSIINDDETHTLNMPVLGDSEPGYGLVQWTPYYKYTNWCTENNLDYWDIDSQLQRICYEVGLTGSKAQWIAREDKGYNLTFSEFTTSTKDAYWLAGAFAFCYERPGSSTGTAEQQDNLKIERGNNATYWYEYLSNFNFTRTEEADLILSTIIQPSDVRIENINTGTLNDYISLYLTR